MARRERHGTEATRLGVGQTSVGRDGSTGIGRAHAKVILLGEHAVVYGVPALAIPVPQLTVTATAVRLSDEGVPAEIAFTSAETAPPMAEEAVRGLQDLVARFKKDAGIDDGTPLRILVDSMIPSGRGLGASAATARAVALALDDLFGCGLDAKTVFDLVQTAETAAHGKASGIDAVATGTSGLIRYVSGVAEELGCGFAGVFVVADSGTSGRTKDAIEHVRRVFDADPLAEAEFLRRVSSLTDAGVRSLSGGQPGVFGAQLTENHEVLRKIGLSTDHIDALVAAALAAGSGGAKISGGGLGGCMIALTGDPEQAQEVAAALHAAGAVATWFVPVGRFADGGG